MWLPTTRATTSVAPPAGKPTTSRIGFSGHCAAAAPATAATANKSQRTFPIIHRSFDGATV